MQRRFFFSGRMNALGFLWIILLVFNQSHFITAATGDTRTETDKVGRHFILLLDSKVARENIFKKSSKGIAGEDFFYFLKDTLEKNPFNSSSSEEKKDNNLDFLDYKTFNEDKDIVSIVLHHYNSPKSKNAAYFYTFTNIIFIRNFFESKNELISSLNNDIFRKFKTFIDPISVEKIEKAEEQVLPFLSARHDYYMKLFKNKMDSSYIINYRELQKYSIKNIVIISIYDGENRKNTLSEMNKEWKEFNSNFEYKLIKSFPNSYGENIYVDYLCVKPHPETNLPPLKINKDNNCQLEAVAIRSQIQYGQVGIYWKGNSGFTGSPGIYRLEWSPGPADGSGESQWNKIDEFTEENSKLTLSDNYSTVKIKKIESIKEQEQDKKSKIEIFYRMTADEFKIVGNLKYPFKYGPTIEIGRISYELKESEKYVLGFPWIKSVGKVDDKDLVEKMVDSKELSELSTSQASEMFEKSAYRKLISIYTSIVVLFFLFYLRYTRNPKIQPVLYRLEEEIPVDFSRENRPTKAIAALELHNTRTWLAKHKKRKTFDLNLQVEWGDYPGENNAELNLNSGEILAIEKILDREARKEPAVPLKWSEDGSFHLQLPGACAGEKYKILLNTGAIQDLSGENREKKEVETIISESRFNFISAVFIKKGKPVPLVAKSRTLKIAFKYIFTAGDAEPEIQLQQVQNEENINFQFDPEYERFIIPYSTLRLQQELFKITVKNKSKYKFSRYCHLHLTYKVFEENALLDTQGKIFYLICSDHWNPGNILPDVQELNLSYGEEAVFHFYINFKDIAENPRNPRNFRIQVLKDGVPIKDGDMNITVTGSIERTEALICFKGENEPVYPEEKHKYRGILNEDKELVINDDSENGVSLAYRFPEQGRMDIQSGKPTPLFSLELRNSSITHTGWYKWDIRDFQLVPNEYISLEKGESSGAIFYKIYKGTKKIEDTKESWSQMEFYLDYEKVRLKKYEISFDVTFSLDIIFYSLGEEKGETSQKRIDITAVIEGRHSVVPDYLVIDFGTSAIAVERRSRTGDGGEQENTHRMQFKSPPGHLESKNGLLPSVINLNENEIIGSHRFVSLPAEENLMSIEPDRLVSSLKMRILDGNDKIEFPGNFSYINEYGSTCSGMDKNRKICTCKDEDKRNCKRIRQDFITCNGDHIDLHGLLLSTYRNLKQNYLNPDEKIRGYKKLIITHPNLYNKSHKQFLKQVLFNAFVDPAENIYDRNIILVSESDASLYYYLQKIAEEKDREKAENILVIDIGGGTLDISLAKVKWEDGGNKPRSVEITRKDGVGFAGEVLDKAIALQVHHILLQYEKEVKGYVESASSSITLGDDAKEQIFRKIEAAQGEDRAKGKTSAEKIVVEDNDDFKFKYVNKIAGEETRKKNQAENVIQLMGVMLAFKYEHILAFKENLSSDASPDRLVELCLGGNGTSRGLCQMNGQSIPLTINFNGKPVQTSIESGSDGNLYLQLKREDWLQLPYLVRFKELFKEKIDAFFDSDKKNIPGNLLVVLSGRTSLWPDIPDALKSYLGIEPRLVYKNNHHTREKGLKMKQAVADGALQKIATWGYIPFTDIGQIGKPAVRYQTGSDFYNPDCWTVKTLDKNKPEKIDLGSSDIFHLGIKTSMDFVPFMGANYFERVLYCNKNMEATIYVEEYKENEEDDTVEWEFFIGSDKYKKKRLLIEHGAMKYHFLNLRGTNWPIKNPQLPELEPGEFDERV